MRSIDEQVPVSLFLKDVQRQSFLVVRFARAFSGRRTWEIRAFRKDTFTLFPVFEAFFQAASFHGDR